MATPSENLRIKVGKKFDTGKAPVVQGVFDYFPRAIMAVAKVSEYGHNKYDVAYDDQNWRRVEDAIDRYRDANGRHMLYESIDGLHDPESKLLHAAHAAWNALAYLEMMLTDGAQVEDNKLFLDA